ncbi:hypothetical protein KXV32_004281 [Aspergillus fumigatus]|nr:hypothetical protein KXV32_004281 [Aspergillus fumigatus]
MEATSVYGIAAGGFFIALVSVRLVSLLLRFTSVVSVWIAIHLIYPYLLGRHSLMGPWTRVSVIGHLLYVAANLFVLCFRPSTVANVGHRAGRLSLINMAVLFAGSPLVYLADIIGVSLRGLDVRDVKIDNIFAIIGAGVLGAILFFSLPFLRCHAYEVFLRVISWSNEEQDTLELFVQPWRGFLADLLRAAEDGPVSFPAYITGPHGTSELVDQYESVLAIATDFGVAAVIPYFRKLIDNCNKSVARARRLHFVWQVQTRDDAIAGESLLNSLLEDDEDDILHKRSILTISLFVKSGPAENILFLGDHERAFIHCEEPNYREIIEVEASGQYITRLSNSEEARGEPLVMVSASDKLRDEICFIVRDHLADRMRMTELEYQPL